MKGLIASVPQLLVTLSPSFPHFPRFARDGRLGGVRINSAMMNLGEVDAELERVAALPNSVPLYFDVKGRQLRVAEVIDRPDHLDLRLNHRITLNAPLPFVVLFKSGNDRAVLERVEEDGQRLIFRGGPHYRLRVGESLHIRHPNLVIHGPLFTDLELLKIEKVKAAGFKRWFLSYVEEQSDVEALRELVGPDAELMLKIESQRGLEYVRRHFRKQDGVRLVAARGDLYVELGRPHEILNAMRLIIEHDPEACAASRILLSVVTDPVPSCADFAELAWLYDIGYRKFMLCDDICIREEPLARAVNVFDAFVASYAE